MAQTNVMITWNHGKSSRTERVNMTESGFYKEAGKTVLLLSDGLPDDILMECPYGSVKFHVIKRGTWIENGHVYDSPFVQSVTGHVQGLQESEYPEAYLTCIHPESNNYKFYWFKPENVAGRTVRVGATYGRIGADRGEMYGARDLKTPIEPIMYWPRYYEKLAKGYVDVSTTMLSKDVVPLDTGTDEKKAPMKNSASKASVELYGLLMSLARRTVNEVLATPANITYKQVQECWKLWEELGTKTTVDEFNAVLRALLCLSPRKAMYIEMMFAVVTDDFQAILDREENLINAMQMVLTGKTSSDADSDSFDDLGVEVWYANDWQKEHVMKRIPDAYKGYVQTIYRVIPKERKAAFDTYVKAEGIKNEDIHEKWHGSRNANWGTETGILARGLRFRNNAKFTGNMLGTDPAIYFADNFLKSKGYTSWDEAYWTNDRSSTAVMALFAVATGNVYEQRTNVRAVSKAFLKKNGYHCTKAWKGARTSSGYALRDSEIAIFDENACVCRYIIVFKK